MTILDAVRSTLPLSRINDPNTPLFKAISELLDGPATHSGATVNERSALRLVPVFAATSLIANSIGSLPVRILREGDVRRRPVHLPAHRALWARPNPEETRIELIESALLSILLAGNAYLSLFRDRGANLAEMYVLDPRKVRVLRPRSGPRRGEKLFEIEGELFGQEEILHIPGMKFPGQLEGMSPIRFAAETIGVGLAAEEYAARFWGNGTLTDGYLSTEANLSPGAAAQLQNRWQRSHGGFRRAHRIAVLDNAAKFERISVSPADAQFLESRKFTIAQIASLFRVAPHLIGDVDRSTSWGSGIEEQNVGFVVHTLRPWIVRLEQRFETLLGNDLRLKFVVDGLLRGSQRDRYQAYQIGRAWGWLSVNDVLGLEDRPGIGPAGDVYLQPLNMEPAGIAPPAAQRSEDRAPAPLFDGRARSQLEQRALLASALVRLQGFAPEAALLAVRMDPIEHYPLLEEALEEERQVARLAEAESRELAAAP